MTVEGPVLIKVEKRKITIYLGRDVLEYVTQDYEICKGLQL